MSPDRRLVLSIFLAAAVTLLAGLWLAWTLYQLRPSLVLTSGLEGCRMPADTEQLVVIHAWRGNRLVARCVYVGSPGTYGKRAR